MRSIISTSILVCFVATLLQGHNAGVVPARLKSRTAPDALLNASDWSIASNIIRRVPGGCCGGVSTPNPGGSRGGSPGGSGGRNSPPSGSGDRGSPGGSGNRTPQNGNGQTGGASDGRGTESGAGTPPDGGSGSEIELPPPPSYQPSARNNYNKPAVDESVSYRPVQPIDLNAKVAEFKKTIGLKGITEGPWYFYSGFEDRRKAYELAMPVSKNVAKTTSRWGLLSIAEVMPPAEDDLMLQRVKGGPDEDYFWASNSIAYSQAIQGKVYIAIPQGRAINQPYEKKGSMLWTFEIPDLTRNPYITEIISVEIKDEKDEKGKKVELEDRIGDQKVIWKQWDEPLGTIADPLYKETRPQEAWKADA